MATPKPLPTLIPPPLLSQTVQDMLKQYILENRLRPGDSLPPETELVRQLGISRNSVREAVKSLAALGIIDVRRGSGLYVGDFAFEPLLENLSYGVMFDLDTLADFLEVRKALEAAMIGRAVTTMPAEQTARLVSILEEMRVRAARGEAFPEVDRAFHRCLFDHLNNRVLTTLLDTFWLVFNKASEHADLQNRDPMATYHAHAAVVDAVLAGDSEQARVALNSHHSGLQERLEGARRNSETSLS